MREWALKSSRVVTPDGIRPAAVHIQDRTIVGVGPAEGLPSGLEVVDVGDFVVLPGLVDTHVHVNEPGRTEWEGFETATRAAAAGGVTTLIDMPLNSIPVTTTPGALEAKRDSAKGQCWIDVGFWGGVVPGNANDLTAMVDGGIFGFKCFLCHSGIDDFPNVLEADLRLVMPILAKANVPLLVHAELEVGAAGDTKGSPQAYGTYLASRPARWENEAIRLMIGLAKETGCRVHIVHLSSAEALPMILRAKDAGVPITVETCPHYLSLTAEGIADGHTVCKCAPPIRDEHNRQRLWQGLRDDVIDFVVSDHSPCTPELKLLPEGDFMQAWGGISSLQFGLDLVWTEASQRGVDLTDVVRWLSAKPAAFAGLTRKGAIAAGKDADLVVWDPAAAYELAESQIRYKNKLSPYVGKALTGGVVATYLRGEKIYEHGAYLGGPQGELLRHHA